MLLLLKCCRAVTLSARRKCVEKCNVFIHNHTSSTLLHNSARAASSSLFFFLSIHILEERVVQRGGGGLAQRQLWTMTIWSIMIQIQVVSIPQFTQKMKRHFSRESTSLNITAVGANSYIVETRRQKMRRVIILCSRFDWCSNLHFHYMPRPSTKQD